MSSETKTAWRTKRKQTQKRGISVKARKKKGSFSMKAKAPAILRSHAVEIKWVDVTNGGTPPVDLTMSQTTANSLMNGLLLGTGPNQRLGRKIRLKSLRLRGIIRKAQGTAPGLDGDFGRVFVVYDRQANAVGPAYADLMQSTDLASNQSSTVWDHFNMSNSDRFKILRSYEYNAYPSTAASITGQPAQEPVEAQQTRIIDDFIPLTDLVTQYNSGNTGGVADITTGSLYVFAQGNELVANATMKFSFTARLRFEDL